MMRIFLTIMVIVLHSTEVNDVQNFNNKLNHLIWVLVRWPVPIFVMLSGYLIGKRQDSINIYTIKHYLLTIIFPLVYFLGIYSLPLLIREGFIYENILKHVNFLISGGHLWYLYAMIPIFFLFLFIRFPKFSNIKSNYLYIIILLSSMFYVSLSNKPFYHSFLKYQWFSLLSSWLGWLLLGYGLFSLPKEKIQNHKYVYLFLFLSSSIYLFYLFVFGGFTGNMRGIVANINSLPFKIQIISLAMFYRSLDFNYLNKYEAKIKILSNCCLGIYGWHILMISMGRPFVYRIFPSYNFIFLIAHVFITVIASFIIVFIEQKLLAKFRVFQNNKIEVALYSFAYVTIVTTIILANV